MKPIQVQAADSKRADPKLVIQMRNGHSAPTAGHAVVAVVLLAALSVLTSCGVTTSGNLSTASTTATISPTGAAVGTAGYNGCPAQQAPADASSFTPDVVVTQQTDSAQPIHLTQGQRLEVRLEPTVQWSATFTDADHAFQSSSIEGWYDSHPSACVWRFSAVGAGHVRLFYRGPVICAPHPRCPVATVQTQDYDVTVR